MTDAGASAAVASETWPDELAGLPATHLAQLLGARRQAAEEAQQLLAQPPGRVLLVDVETDRLTNPRIVEVCVLDTAGTVRYLQRVHPGRLQDPEAVKVHKIKDEDLIGCPAFEAIAAELDQVLAPAATVVAYGAHFDQPALRGEWGRLPGRPLPPRWTRRGSWWCAMEGWSRHAMAWDPEEQRYRRIRLGGDHTTQGDTSVLLERLHVMAGSLAAA
ncbi:3'-5' exonuclease [Kitasatospora purpeofusca]|uniref:3'-5' exonuclease n=1 Tax=Kitasatospora purpeofusca TaxID=67352 RepID=UPI0036AA6871